MALTAKYTEPMQIVATPKMKRVVKEIADREQNSLAAVYRRLIEKGLTAEGYSL